MFHLLLSSHCILLLLKAMPFLSPHSFPIFCNIWPPSHQDIHVPRISSLVLVFQSIMSLSPSFLRCSILPFSLSTSFFTYFRCLSTNGLPFTGLLPYLCSHRRARTPPGTPKYLLPSSQARCFNVPYVATVCLTNSRLLLS